MTHPAPSRGQASVELLALIPLLALVAASVWQVTAIVAATLRAEESARRTALTGTGGTHREPVVAILPGMRGLVVVRRSPVIR